MDTSRTLSRTDLDDIIKGACILGSGGGGPLAVAKELVADLQKYDPVVLLDPAEVPDETLMAVAAVDGSPIAALSGPFPYEVATQAFDALNALQKTSSGKDLAAVLAIEVGAGNSLIPMIVAAMKKLPIIDGAGVRRAVPQLSMCTFATANLPVSPIALADQQTQISLNVPDAVTAEQCVRAVVDSGVFPEFAGLALWPMNGAAMRRAVIPRVVTYAQGLGRQVREAVDTGGDPVEAAMAYLGGYLLFRGRHLAVNEQTTGGFDIGLVTLQSDDGSAQCQICTKNENLIAWNTTQALPLAMAPDLICYLQTNGEPLSNADLSGLDPSQEVAIIGAPVDAQLRAPVIVARFRQLLNAAGYFGSYQPIEVLQQQRSQA